MEFCNQGDDQRCVLFCASGFSDSLKSWFGFLVWEAHREKNEVNPTSPFTYAFPFR